MTTSRFFDKQTMRGWGLLLVVNALWAVQYPAYRVGAVHVAPATLNVWVLGIASVVLLPFWLRSTTPSRRALLRSMPQYLWLAAFGILPPSVMMAWGISRSTASNAALLSLTIPAGMAVLGSLLLKERFTPTRFVSFLLGVSGGVLLSGASSVGALLDRQLLTANLVIFFAGMGSAFYNTWSKRLLSSHSELEILLFSYLWAFLLSLIGAFAFETNPFSAILQFEALTWIAVGALATTSWGIGMVLWLHVLSFLQAGRAAVSIYLLPFLGLLLSWAILGESFTGLQVVGGTLALAGAVVACTDQAPVSDGS